MSLKDQTLPQIGDAIAGHTPTVATLREGAEDMGALDLPPEVRDFVGGRQGYYEERLRLCGQVDQARLALLVAIERLENHGFPTLQRAVAPAPVFAEIRENRRTIDAFAEEVIAEPEAVAGTVEVGEPED